MTKLRSDFLRVLDERGFIHQCSDLAGLEERARKGSITGYIGFDCTAPSLHVGSLMQIMALRWLQKTGNRPIILIGGGTEVVKHFMEIRGLGLIDIRSMFGIRAIRFQKRVEIVIELQEWKKEEEYTRTGLDSEMTKILDVEVPLVKLPIFPGKNITVIAEVIALNYLLKHYGYDAAKEFTKRLESVISEKSKALGERAIDYFEHDFE